MYGHATKMVAFCNRHNIEIHYLWMRVCTYGEWAVGRGG